VVQRVSLRSQDFVLVHADKLCVRTDHCTIMICNLMASCLDLPQCTADRPLAAVQQHKHVAALPDFRLKQGLQCLVPCSALTNSDLPSLYLKRLS
jgi:hypothetical protein